MPRRSRYRMDQGFGQPFVLNRASPQARGLVAWWPPNGSRGTNVLRDYVGGNHGAFSGDVSWARNAKLGSVLSYGGTNGHVNCGSAARLDNLATGKAFSYAVWVEFTSIANETLLSKESASSSGWFTRIISTARIETKFNAAVTDALSRSDAIISTGVLYHIAITYDDNGDRKARIYVNGLEVAGYQAQDAAVGALVDDSARDLTIGSLSPSFWFMSGIIGDVRMAQVRWNPAEVRHQFTQPWDLYKTPGLPWAGAPAAVGNPWYAYAQQL